MCHHSCLDFVAKNLTEEEVSGKSFLEVGAYDVNGTVRPLVVGMNPASYVGVDIEMGPGVDVVCDAGNLAERFGADAFDILLCTEVLEHVREWRTVVSNLKKVIKPGGLLILTTRSKGFVYHGYPYDFWRYEALDMQRIFSDFLIDSLESDPLFPGVFLKARKPYSFAEADLSALALYSVMTESYRTGISDLDVARFRAERTIGPFLARILPQPMKKAVKRLYDGLR